MVDDVVAGLEYSIREPAIALELPDVFNRVEFGGARRQWQDRNVIRLDQILRQMPTRLIHDETRCELSTGCPFGGADTPVNESLVRELAAGSFVADQRNVVLVGGTGTGTGKSHLAIAIARALIRSGTRGHFFNVVDLVNRLETETRNGSTADYINRLDFIVLDELGYLPFAQGGASSCSI